MSDSDDSDSILPTLQKTRDLWNQKSVGDAPDYLVPASKPIESPSRTTENHVNGTEANEDVTRSEDKNEDDFDMPDVKSMKSQWEKAGPVPMPKKSAPVVERKQAAAQNHMDAELVPVNRKQEATEEEEYDVKLGALREKFELEAKAASSSKVVWSEEPKSSVSKAAVGEKKNMERKHASQNKARLTASSSTKTPSNKRFETEIEAQKHYHSTKEGPVEMPVVELSSLKQQFEQRKDEKMVVPMRQTSANSNRKNRQTSISSDCSTPASEIVRYDDPPAQEEKYEVEISSLRKRFEQGGAITVTPAPKSRPTVHKKVPDPIPERQRAASESDNASEIVRSSDARYDEMIGEESVKDRLARYKAMTEAASALKSSNSSKKQIPSLVVKPQPVEEETPQVTSEEQGQEIVRSPPAGTKERPDYKASIDLEQARQLFEQKSDSPPRSGRSSRSSSGSPRRRAPRSHSTPSPIYRGSSTSSSRSSKSPSPERQASASSSRSSRTSGRGSPAKKFGDPDVVVLEHAEVNYYYEEDGTRVSAKTKGPDDLDKSSEDMEVVKPAPAGTKEEPDFVPSVNLRSVRSMFENPKEEDFSRGRAPTKKVIIEKYAEEESAGNSPAHNPNIVRSTAAGSREEVAFEMSIDLKTARSRFESPNRLESYVPKNKIRQREEEVRRQKAAAAATSPRSSESSDSGYEVVKPTEPGAKENPDYQVDLKAAKQKFEGGKAPVPIMRETKTRQQPEIKGEIVRPEPAGTKEIVEIHASDDVKSAKKKFQSLTMEEEEDEARRKSPIDIQEEARMVIRKEREIAEEVQKPIEECEEPARKSSSSSSDSESEPTDTEGEVILEPENESHDPASHTVPDRHISVSSEELVEKEEVEEVAQEEPQESATAVKYNHEAEQRDEDEEEAPAAAVVPVRVAISESLTEKQEEDPEPLQDYGTYAKVIDYNEDIQHTPQSSSDSESEKESEVKTEDPGLQQEEQNISGVDDLKQVGPEDETNVDSSYESNEAANHLDDSLSSDDQKGISSASSNQDDSQHQLSPSSSQGEEIPGKANDVSNNYDDIFGILSQTNDAQPIKSDPFADFTSSTSPPQLQPDPFGGGLGSESNDPFDPFSSMPAPPPRRAKKVDPDAGVNPADSSLLDVSDDEDYDKPHFNYPYDEVSPPKVEAPAQNTNANNNGLDDIFGDMSWNPVTSNGTSGPPPASNSDLLGDFGANAQSGGDPLADLGGGTTGSSNVDFGGGTTVSSSVDPFDIFAKPADPTLASGEKDPFDLFA